MQDYFGYSAEHIQRAVRSGKMDDHLHHIHIMDIRPPVQSAIGERRDELN